MEVKSGVAKKLEFKKAAFKKHYIQYKENFIHKKLPAVVRVQYGPGPEKLPRRSLHVHAEPGHPHQPPAHHGQAGDDQKGGGVSQLFLVKVLDLYELYNLVVEKGGLVEVINKKQWQEIIKVTI